MAPASPYQYDPAEAIVHISKRDPDMRRLIECIGEFAPDMMPFSSPYEALTRSIVYQQLSAASAGAIHGRLLAAFAGNAHPTPGQVRSLDDDAIRAIGLSRAKTAALRDLSQRATDGLLPDRQAVAKLTDEQIIELGCAITGIGVWTVQMMLIFCLGRGDVLPATDLGIRKGFMLTYGGEMPKPGAIVTHSEIWRPFRTVASWYLWQATYLPEALCNTGQPSI